MLLRILQGLAEKHESWIIGKQPWTTDRISPELLATMMKGIVGAKLSYESLRGTQKRCRTSRSRIAMPS